MKKISLMALLAFVFLVNGNFTKAQSLDYQAYNLFNLLEHLYSEFLSPVPQITKLDEDGAFYRSYPDAGIEFRTSDGRLYLHVFGDGELVDLG